MLNDVNLHYLTLPARCPVSGCWPSCYDSRKVLCSSNENWISRSQCSDTVPYTMYDFQWLCPYLYRFRDIAR